MADASAEPISTNHVPFVARARLRAFVSRTQGAVAGITVTYFDQRDRIVGSALCSLDEIEQHARDLLAAVNAARATDAAVVPIGLMPRSESTLMPDLRVGAR